MKRNREVTIIVDALIKAGILKQAQEQDARDIVKNAMKDIRREKYAANHTNKLKQMNI